MREPSMTAYVLAVAATAVAGSLRWALDAVLGESSQFILYYFSVMFAAIAGGTGPGLLAVLLGAVAGTWYFFAAGHVGPTMVDDAARLFMFLVFGAAAIFLAGRLHSARNQANARATELSQSLARLKAAQQALGESEERFRAVCENAWAAFGILDGTRLVYANRHFAELTGYSVEEILSMDFRQMTHTSFHELMMDRGRRRLSGEPVPSHYEFLAITKSGEERWVDLSTAVTELNGRRVIIGTGFDITDRKRAEAALTESEAQFRAFFENAAVGAVQLDPEGRLVNMNDRYCQITGYSREELLGTNPVDLVHPDDRERDRELNLRFLRGELPVYEVEKRYVRKDGRVVWVHVTASLIRDGAGRPLRTAGVLRDITARKEAEAALRESEGKFRGLVENIPAAIGIVQGTRFVYANRHFAEMFGYSVPEILSLDFPQVVHPDYREMMIDRARRRQSGEPMPGNYEFIGVAKSGEERWIDFWPAYITYHGKPAIIGAGLDITERKRAEQALRQSEEKFRIVAEHTYDWEFWLAPDGRFLYNSKSCRNVTGYDAAAFEEDPELLERIIHPADRPRWHEHRGGGAPACATEEAEYRIIRQDGGIRWIGHTCLPVYGEDGRFLGIRANNRDITERKQAAEELAAAKRSADKARTVAEEASRAKDHFLAVLSHELRTPLTPVLATVSMLQEESHFDEETHQSLEMIRRNVELETRLIDDLLDMTRIARGKVKLEKRPVELCTVIGRAVEVCRGDIDARGLHFGVDLGPNPPYWVEADVGRLQQVFWNLLKNAIKFTPHGGCVGIRCCREGNGGSDRVLAEVNDSGEGIEPEALARIFDAFEQARNSANRQFGGLGLGLTISKALVEMHGGIIEAHSDGKGKGASFRVHLPTIKPAHPSSGARERGPAAAVASTGPATLRILFVEDHGDTARIMKRLLERRGHSVQTAGDVATALDLAAREAFDLLVSDLGLPDGSGLDLMRRLRASGSNMKGIALSGYGMDADVQRSREAGFSEHLTKPIAMSEMQRAIERVTLGID